MKELTLTECSKRKLDSTYIVVYAIKNEINIKKAEYIEKSDIYTLIALVVTILFSYDEKIKCSNSKGFRLQII